MARYSSASLIHVIRCVPRTFGSSRSTNTSAGSRPLPGAELRDAASRPLPSCSDTPQPRTRYVLKRDEIATHHHHYLPQAKLRLFSHKPEAEATLNALLPS